MRNKIIASRLACFCWLLVLTQAVRAENLGDMLSQHILDSEGRDSAWSVWVGGNLEKKTSVGKLQGRAFVRGDFTVLVGTEWYSSELGDVAGGLDVFSDSSLPAMVVGGSILGPGAVKVVGGMSVQVGSNIASNVKLVPAETVVSYGGVDYVAADKLRAELSAKSQYWGSLPDTPGGTVEIKWSQTFITADRGGG